VPGFRRRDRLNWLLERHIAYVLVLPTALAVALINLYPLAYTFLISFQEFKLSSSAPRFIGLSNYARLLSDAEVWHSIQISGIFVVVSVGLSFGIGLVLALLLNRPLRGRSVIRSLFIVPWAIPAFVAALIWSWMYNDQFGIFGALLRQVGVSRPPIFLGRDYALMSLITVMTWKSFPFQLVILLAGLQSIPADLYEAAAVDGAGTWRRFRSITLPLLRPVALISVLLAAINAFHYFPIPWILTRGGPSNATNVIPIATYQIAFAAGDFGYGAAAAFLMFAFIGATSAIYIWSYLRSGGSV
jgi:multiple sugar transport system permease protein